MVQILRVPLHPAVVKKYLSSGQRRTVEWMLGGNRRSDGTQSLAGELQADAQQFLRHVRLPLLEFFPPLIIQEPGDGVFLRHHRGRSIGLGEERELATRGAGHDGLVVFALRQIVPGTEDTVLQQVEPVGSVPALVEPRSGGVVLADEKRTGLMPEVLVLVRQALKRLEDQGERLLEVLPLGRR